MDKTKIEWCDSTLNYLNGCSRMSPGCGGPGKMGGCYAERLAGTRLKHTPSREGLTKPTPDGPRWTGEVRPWDAQLLQALRWKRGRRIFWNAHGDIGHVNVKDEWIARQLAVCAMTPQHTHMLLSKRPDRLLEYLTREHVRADIMDQMSHLARDWKENARGVWAIETWPLPNVWIGTSIEDRKRLRERAPVLLQIPAALHFWSAEPLLEDLGEIRDEWLPDWIIVGGESGQRARFMLDSWAQNIVDQALIASKPVFVKQLSSGGRNAIRDLEDFPPSLRYRNMPA